MFILIVTQYQPAAGGVGPEQPTFVPDMPQDHPLPDVETCEMRRAREYGIEVGENPGAIVGIRPPDPKRFSDPIAFSMALSTYAQRSGITIKAAAALYGNRVVDTGGDYARFRREFDGLGEGENR